MLPVMVALAAGAAHATKREPPKPKPASEAAKPAPLSVEQLKDGAALTATERVYVADVAISHIADGRLRVFDARKGTLLGMVNTGYAGNFVVSSKADELYVATTYLSRGGRGDRVDVLEVWDTNTLVFKYEVLLPPKRAQALNYRGLVHRTANGRFVLVQNATPASSVTVVDLQERKVAGEVPTPGCWGVWPSASSPARFSTLCGDGTLTTITLDAAGAAGERQVSEKFFDGDRDAWFHSADQLGDRLFYVSFRGTVTELDISGATARRVASNSIVRGDAVKAGWRPGGYQPIAVHPDGKLAVVAMHDKGREGSHKLPGKQLWTIDLASGRRVAAAPALGSVTLAFSKSGRRLHALDGATGALRVWQWDGAGRMKTIATVAPAGEASLHLETHD
jgi:methylamine dehydrogenase heavy chain